MSNPSQTQKLIIRMNMPDRCGTCPLVKSKISGDAYCCVTQDKVDKNLRYGKCPLSLYTPQSSKSLPCKVCGSKLKTKHHAVKDGVVYKWYQCKRCRVGEELAFQTTTWATAKAAWNEFSK